MNTFFFIVVPEVILAGDVVHFDGQIAEYAFEANSEREAHDLVFPKFCCEHPHHSHESTKYQINCISS